MASKKETNRNYIIGVIVVIAVLIGVFFVLRTPTEPEPIVPAPTEPEPTQAPDVTDEGTIQYGSRGILSDVKCTGRTISAIITNVKDSTMKILPNAYGNDLILMVNGNRIQDFVCDKSEVAKDEYVVCSDIVANDKQKQSMVRTERENIVAVWFKGDTGNRGTVNIMCDAVE